MTYADGLETQTRAAFAREQQRQVLDPPDPAQEPPVTMEALFDRDPEKATDILLEVIGDGQGWTAWRALCIAATRAHPNYLSASTIIDACEKKAGAL